MLADALTAAAPAEPDWWARGFGLGGLILAFVGLWLNHHRDRVDIEISVGQRVRWYQVGWTHTLDRPGGIWLTVRAVNKGRAAGEVTNGWWEAADPGPPFDLEPRATNGERPPPPGDAAAIVRPFPLEVPGLSTREWVTTPPSWGQGKHGVRVLRMRYVVRLGHEKRVRSPWILVMLASDDGPVGWRELDRMAWPRLWRSAREVLSDWRRPSTADARRAAKRAAWAEERNARRENMEPSRPPEEDGTAGRTSD